MTAIERPVKKALADALDIYRDSMRPFVIRNLKRVPGISVKDAIGAALRDGQYNQFEQNLKDGRDVEDAIDIGEFPQLIRRYWRDAFHEAFRRNGASLGEVLHTITDARNKVAHPDGQDIEREYAITALSDISGILAEINAPDQSREVDAIRDALTPFSTPAHKFQQGGRDVYSFALDIETLDELLPDRVDDGVVKDANRQLTPTHARNIQKYLDEKNDWILGTLLLGIRRDALEFQSYMEDPNAESAVGDLFILDAGAMKMFDGQHRRRAIKDLVAELSGNRARAKKLESLKSDSLPIMLYAEDSIEALRQMFADAAQTRTIERNIVTRFDQRDAFNIAALWIAENSDLFQGRVEMERTSVSRTSHCIIAINQLAATLKTIEVGYNGRVSKERNDAYMLDLDSLFERCLTWADDFMPASREEYNTLMAGEMDNSEIPAERAKTMAYSAAVIRLLAGCYYEWTKDGADLESLSEFLANASLDPNKRRGALLVDAGMVAPGGTTPIVRQSVVLHAIDHIVNSARESIG